MLHLAIVIHIQDNEMYTSEEICLFDSFSHPTDRAFWSSLVLVSNPLLLLPKEAISGKNHPN